MVNKSQSDVEGRTQVDPRGPKIGASNGFIKLFVPRILSDPVLSIHSGERLHGDPTGHHVLVLFRLRTTFRNAAGTRCLLRDATIGF
jgi:hypothetical protein